jgi:hypothetical protein
MKKLVYYLIFILIISILASGCITGAHVSSGGSFGMSVGGNVF